MSDQTPNDDQPRDGDATSGGEKDHLDSLLAAAADLAAEVADEVGRPDSTQALTDADVEFLESGGPDSADVDAQLEQLEQLAQSTCEQVGAAEGGDATLTVPIPDADDSQTAEEPEVVEKTPPRVEAANEVNDDLDDLTRPTADPAAETLGGDGSSAASAQDDDLISDPELTQSPTEDDAVDAFGSPPPHGASGAPKVAAASVATAAKSTAPDEDDLCSPTGDELSSDGMADTKTGALPAVSSERPEPAPSKPRAVAIAMVRQGEKAALPLASMAVSLLERLDRLVGGALSDRIKTMVSWVALATLGTAVMTLAWSMLR